MFHLATLCSALLLLACGDAAKPTAPTQQETSTNAIPLTLIDIEFSDAGTSRALLSGPANSRIILPSEPCPSTAIDLRLDDFVFPRPLTHDLLISAADSLGVSIIQILLESTGGIPHAHLVLGDDAATELDATIGDALAIHQQTRIPLLATPELVAAYTDTTPAAKTSPPAIPRAERPLRSPSARLAQNADLVEMRMLGIAQVADDLALILVDLDDRLAFPFFVGFCQAASINATFNRLVTRETSTHLLFYELLIAAKTTVVYGRITELKQDTYIGTVGLRRGAREIVLDARPSDAIALALRTGAPIEVAQNLLASVGEEAGPFLDIFAAGKRVATELFSH